LIASGAYSATRDRARDGALRAAARRDDRDRHRRAGGADCRERLAALYGALDREARALLRDLEDGVLYLAPVEQNLCIRDGNAVESPGVVRERELLLLERRAVDARTAGTRRGRDRS